MNSSKSRTRFLIVFSLITFLIFFTFLVFGSLSLVSLRNQKFNAAGSADDVIYVKPGSNVKTIVKSLVEKGYIKKKNIKLSYYILRFIDRVGTVHSAEYKVSSQETLKSFANKLKEKQYYYRSITLIEGETIEQFKKKLEDNEYLSGEITESAKEGYLFPETYKFLRDEKRNFIIKLAKERMEKISNIVFMKAKENPDFYLKTKHEFLTLASIIQMETFKKEDMEKVATVFKNRLKLGMKLQSDVTVIYEITRGAYRFSRHVTIQDTKKGNEYNTYVIPALPIGPIANPGLQAMESIIESIDIDNNYVFFMANQNKEHSFTTSFSKHKDNHKKYDAYLKKNNIKRGK